MTTSADNCALHLGIDVGSTTVKVAVLDGDDQIIYSVYRRHHADVRATVLEVLKEASAQFPDKEVTVAITGSGGCCFRSGWGWSSSKRLSPRRRR